MIDFIKDLLTPSQGFTTVAYQRAVIAMAHAALGATAALAAGAVGFWLLYVLVALYLIKEYRDVRRGGKMADSAEDTCAVLVGALGYAAAPMMLPAVLMAVGAVVGVVASVRYRR